MREVDVLVIGGGIAGFAAALAALGEGARTALVRRGPGATALAAGGWNGVPPEPVREALEGVGFPLRVGAALLPHADGRLLASDAAPPAHAAAAVAAGAEPVLVCGIAGLAGFHAHALAALWSDAAALPGGALVFDSVTLADTPAAGWSVPALAARLEAEPHVLAAPLARAARKHGSARAILPAVLGINAHARVIDAVRDATGIEACEALSPAPSLPGWRLDQCLLRALRDAGAHVVRGRAAASPSHDAVTAVDVSGADGAESIRVGAVVLATGRFIGGGITDSGTGFRETVLGLASSTPDALHPLTHALRTMAQPVLSAGLLTDDRGRPARPGGEPAFSNVFAAGSVRAGAETGALGLGHAARDGWSAGLLAAAAAGDA
jgi:glycerol-3-phosphate dehydrogenase subunit B